jgi:hypothetical protein
VSSSSSRFLFEEEDETDDKGRDMSPDGESREVKSEEKREKREQTTVKGRRSKRTKAKGKAEGN